MAGRKPDPVMDAAVKAVKAAFPGTRTLRSR